MWNGSTPFLLELSTFRSLSSFKAKSSLQTHRTASQKVFGIRSLRNALLLKLSISILEQKEQKTWKKQIVDVVKAKTLTIVGYGDIGVEVAKWAKEGFEMNIIGIKRNPLYRMS